MGTSTLAGFEPTSVLAEKLGVSPEAIVFLAALFASIPTAAVVRFLPGSAARAYFSIAAGSALCYFAYGGWGASVRLWAPTLGAFILIRVSPRTCGYTVFVAAFAYLTFCHGVSMSGDLWRRGGIDFTGTLMLFTLKLVGCALDVQDGPAVPTEKAHQRKYANRLKEPPSLLEFLAFVFFPGSVLVGPIYDFRSFSAFLHQKEVWAVDPATGRSRVPSAGPRAAQALLRALGCLAAQQLLTSHFPQADLASDRFHNLPFLQRWAFVVCSGVGFRMTYYFVWSTAECAMVLSGFGYCGPSKADPRKPDWSRAVNADVWQGEVMSSMSQLPGCWNIWVGHWLRTYVYDRLTPEGGRPTVWTLIETQIVSALWHGLYPGYYLFFVVSAVAQHASKVVYRAFSSALPQPPPLLAAGHTAFQAVFKLLMISYCIVGFMILRADQTIAVWKSLYFIGTLFPAGLWIIVPKLMAKQRRKLD